EDVDARNQADQMCFQCEKALGEFGDKVDAADKSECEGKINDLKEALKGSDIEAIKAKNKDLEECFQKIATKVYQQAGAQAQGAQGFDPSSMGNMGGAAQQSTNNGGDDVIDADFKDAE
ncbi:MAG: Hsp70 family protein, partial [Ruminococcus sp.]|nr:Hsp70 family protein [Ruminococcus sp.]